MSVPWTKLQHETLAAIIQDLGLMPYIAKTARKRELIQLLQSMELEGLPSLLKRLKKQRISSNTTESDREQSPDFEDLRPVPSSSASSASARSSPAPHTTRKSGKARKIPPDSPVEQSTDEEPVDLDLSNVPPPSYAVLYQQRQNINLPRRDPWPLQNLHEKFDGVVISCKKARTRVGPKDLEGTELSSRPVMDLAGAGPSTEC